VKQNSFKNSFKLFRFSFSSTVRTVLRLQSLADHRVRRL